MSIQLTEKDKALLSAYHDGELSSTDRAKVEHLLKHSAEARAWLHGAQSVGVLSVAAAQEVAAMTTSTKLTGAAIVSAAKQQGVGGSLLNAVRSPWSIAGAVGTLVVSTLLLTNPFSRDGAVPLVESKSMVLPEVIDVPSPTVQPVDFAPDNDDVIVPPISSRDLVSFALEGTLPINEERTSFVALGETDACDEKTVHEVDTKLRSLGRRQLLTLDSLSELLRTAVLRKDQRHYVVRHDLPRLRWSVISQIDETTLSAIARERLIRARKEAEQAQQRVNNRLVVEMNRMRDELMVKNQQPYLLIDAEGITEEPTGDLKQLFLFERIGSQPTVVVLNPTGVNVLEKNPRLVAFVEQKQQATGTLRVKEDTASPSSTLQVQANREGIYPKLEDEVANLFMANVTITLTSKHSKICISSNNDTTFTSSLVDLEAEPEAFYDFGLGLQELTENLNATVRQVALDTTRSVEERAEQIYYLQDQHKQRIQQMLELMRAQREADSTNSPPVLEDGVMDVDLKKEASEEAAQLIPTCGPQENRTGVS